MCRMASRDIMLDFWSDCLSKMDQQEFKLESEEAKKCAIQIVQRVLQLYKKRDGEKIVLGIIDYQDWDMSKRF